jgi:hypothetical protein
MVPSKPERHLASFRCIPPALKRSVDLFADELQVPVGYAARILLEFSLFEFRQGRLKMVPKMSPRGWTLYPEDSPRQSKPVSFRDIPDALFQDIQIVASRLELGNGLLARVDKGEVARKFLEYGLAEHKKQRI